MAYDAGGPEYDEQRARAIKVVKILAAIDDDLTPSQMRRLIRNDAFMQEATRPVIKPILVDKLGEIPPEWRKALVKAIMGNEYDDENHENTCGSATYSQAYSNQMNGTRFPQASEFLRFIRFYGEDAANKSEKFKSF